MIYIQIQHIKEVIACCLDSIFQRRKNKRFCSVVGDCQDRYVYETLKHYISGVVENNEAEWDSHLQIFQFLDCCFHLAIELKGTSFSYYMQVDYNLNSCDCKLVYQYRINGCRTIHILPCVATCYIILISMLCLSTYYHLNLKT